MVELKKNCSEKSYIQKVNTDEDFTEYHYAEKILKKADKIAKDQELKISAIDDYFTALQIISNAVLLKKFKLRSKESVCGYYKLFIEKVITLEIYTKLEYIREKRNLFHYDGYKAMLTSENEIDEIIKECLICYKFLKEVFEK